jgi:hypothetical protein
VGVLYPAGAVGEQLVNSGQARHAMPRVVGGRKALPRLGIKPPRRVSRNGFRVRPTSPTALRGNHFSHTSLVAKHTLRSIGFRNSAMADHQGGAAVHNAERAEVGSAPPPRARQESDPSRRRCVILRPARKDRSTRPGLAIPPAQTSRRSSLPCARSTA